MNTQSLSRDRAKWEHIKSKTLITRTQSLKGSFFTAFADDIASQSHRDESAPTEVDSAVGHHTSYAQDEASQAQAVQIAGIEHERSNDDILRLIPLNTEARRAFDSVVLLDKAGKLDEIHSQHLQVTGTAPLSRTVDLVDSDATTEEASSGSESPASQRMVNTGYFRVRFNKRPVWVIGKGPGKKSLTSRNVDILLAAPGSKDAHGLRAAHAYLRLHHESGAWLLTAGADVIVNDVVLEPDNVIALCNPTTRFDVHNMQYLIRFVVETPEMEQAYLKQRNRLFQEQGIPLPPTAISGIPILTGIVLRSIVFRHGFASGSFGNVFEGFDPNKGDLRVAKWVTLKSQHEVPGLAQEIEALQRFAGQEGIVKLLDWRTSLNGQELIVSQYPLDVYLVHDKGVAFHKHSWKAEDWDLKRMLCYQLLNGLATIHQAGCMHRDITQMNILFFPYQDPRQARLCDFGKFCDTTEATDTCLAAWQFLPPELEKGKRHLYKQALDIWMLGLALANAWFPQTALMQPREKTQYNRMHKFLWDETHDGSDLAHLVVRMMAWDPVKRPTAEEAMKHRSLKKAVESSAPVKTSNAKRLHDHDG
ncbi:MAG: hypothetical protein Q9201_001523 [Fulgogasparrea decipioides]